MNTTKHTPGPWKASFPSNASSVWIMGGDGMNVVAHYPFVPSENNKANAKLIEQAPEMLAALKLFRYQFAALRESLGWREGGGEWVGPLLCGADDKARSIIDSIESNQ